MIDKKKPISIALSYVGYHEKTSADNLDAFEAPNDGNGNYTKFARDLDSINYFNGAKQGYDWCAVSSIAWFVYSFGRDLAQKLLCQPPRSAAAGCVYGAQYFKNKGRFFRNPPETGDIIFFDYGDGINHQGIVVAITNTNVITVEGNVNGMVQQCQHALSANYIAGYGRPCWELYSDDSGPVEEQKPAETNCHVEVDVPIIRYGDTGFHVALMQIILIGRGFSCGSYGADGDYGDRTQEALVTFQTAKGLEADGVCEENTWRELLKGE